MSSNEHPDMSGNPCDDPILCDYCNCPCREDDLYGSSLEEEKTFCSQICAEDYDDEWMPVPEVSDVQASTTKEKT